MDFISIIGSVFSVLGALYAFYQANKAKQYKDEIQQDRKKMVLVDVIGIARHARKECRKIITPVGKPARGVVPQDVINSIRDCIERIHDNIHKFHFSKLNETISKIENQLKNYINENDETQRYSIGDNLYISLGELNRKINEELNSSI